MRHLLDTNVVSELLRSQVNPAVAAWSERQLPQDQAISVVTLAELRFGLELMPAGQRRTALERAVKTSLVARFADRLLPFGPDVADAYGRLLALGRRNGLEVGDRDLIIAATAKVHDLIVITRNIRHFEPLGIDVMNPWSEL